MLRGMTTINYHAVDLAAAVAWYEQLLGVKHYFARLPYYAEFRIGDFQAELGILGVPELPAPAPGGAITYWAVDNLDAALARLRDLGATDHLPPTEHGPGYVTASVIDPFGNIIGVMANQHYRDILAAIGPFTLPPITPDIVAVEYPTERNL